MAKVYVVHCIDTEGPLNENIEATFERVYGLTGKRIKPSFENLEKIQNGEIDLSENTELAKMVFSKRLMSYNRNWHDIDKMLDHILSKEFKMAHADSYGKPWVYNWFLVDFAGFEENPRNRDQGFNNIYNHYASYYRVNEITGDDFQWHAHPMSIYKEAHRCGTSYWNSPHIIESLCHRIIDCGDFPCAFRPGYHTERPDSHFLLEQYIPYDFSNQAVELTEDDLKQKDLSGGRFGDWRRAPATWEPYHPSHDDYQSKGSCHRVIFRCLNVGTRIRLITEDEVEKAFRRAADGEDTILSFCDHDFRDMSYDVDDAYELITKAAEKYPDVKWENSVSYEAARKVLKEPCTPIHLDIHFDDNIKNMLVIETDVDSFGPQPFFAVKTKGNRYLQDNLDVQVPNRKWTYTFDADSIHFDDIEKIGLATNSRLGSGALKVLGADGSILNEKTW